MIPLLALASFVAAFAEPWCDALLHAGGRSPGYLAVGRSNHWPKPRAQTTGNFQFAATLTHRKSTAGMNPAIVRSQPAHHFAKADTLPAAGPGGLYPTNPHRSQYK